MLDPFASHTLILEVTMNRIDETIPMITNSRDVSVEGLPPIPFFFNLPIYVKLLHTPHIMEVPLA